MTLTPELADKIAAWLRAEGLPSHDPLDLFDSARRHGVGLVDTDRQRCVIDERVYEGALLRGRRWEQLALPWISRLTPSAAAWQALKVS